jgi:hypothetical protein
MAKTDPVREKIDGLKKMWIESQPAYADANTRLADLKTAGPNLPDPKDEAAPDVWLRQHLQDEAKYNQSLKDAEQEVEDARRTLALDFDARCEPIVQKEQALRAKE